MTERTVSRVGTPTLLLSAAVAVALVWGGAPGLLGGEAPTPAPERLPVGEVAPERDRAAPGWAQELPKGVTREMIDAGREIYGGVGTCLTCHGAEGVGTPIGPALADGEWAHIEGSYPEIVELITNGVMEPLEFPMPMLPRAGVELDDDQVAAVAAYVWLISRDR